MWRRRVAERALGHARERCFSSQSDEAIVRSTQLASVAVSSLLDAVLAASRTEAADIQAYAHIESENLKRVNDKVVERGTRPSALCDVARATFGLAGVALAAAPTRIRHACIGGLYEALGNMHTENLRALLVSEHGSTKTSHKTDKTGDTNEDLKELEKSLRDTRERFGAPEGSPTGASDLLLAKLMNKDPKIDAAMAAAASINHLFTTLVHASKSI